jgi:lipoprotein-anchoring transpeptidase ErfK/SrfK
MMQKKRFLILSEYRLGNVKPLICEDESPYKKLKNNPSANDIAQVIKDSDKSFFGNDTEAYAEAAFFAIKNTSLYNKVKLILGADPFEFLKSFMDVSKPYQNEDSYSTIENHYYKLFPNLRSSMCSPDDIKVSTWKSLYSTLVERNMIQKNESLLIVWGPTQTMYYTKDGKNLIGKYSVSTAKKGFGNSVDSDKTSTGLLEVTNKIKGKNNEVLIGKKPTGKLLGPNVDSNRIDSKGRTHVAEVLTGILELDGLEKCNENAFSRNIYIHGTNREQFLGSKNSGGCIRVSNAVINELINSLQIGTKVYVYPT